MTSGPWNMSPTGWEAVRVILCDRHVLYHWAEVWSRSSLHLHLGPFGVSAKDQHCTGSNNVRDLGKSCLATTRRGHYEVELAAWHLIKALDRLQPLLEIIQRYEPFDVVLPRLGIVECMVARHKKLRCANKNMASSCYHGTCFLAD